MLSIIASPKIRPEIETIDRDPGIISLVSALVRSGGTALTAGFRAVRRQANDAE